MEGDVATLLASVRRVTSPTPLAMPEGFACVRGDVWSAAPGAWAQAAWPEGVTVSLLSLHDLFLAHALTGGAQAGPKDAA